MSNNLYIVTIKNVRQELPYQQNCNIVNHRNITKQKKTNKERQNNKEQFEKRIYVWIKT